MLILLNIAMETLRKRAVLTKQCVHQQVKFEAAAPVGSTAARPSDDRKWPHLYGTLDHDAVLQRLPVRRNAEGTFVSIEHSEHA